MPKTHPDDPYVASPSKMDKRRDDLPRRSPRRDEPPRRSPRRDEGPRRSPRRDDPPRRSPRRDEPPRRSPRRDEPSRRRDDNYDTRSRRGDDDTRSRRGDDDTRSRRGDDDTRSRRGDDDTRSRRGDRDDVRSRRGDDDTRSRRGDRSPPPVRDAPPSAAALGVSSAAFGVPPSATALGVSSAAFGAPLGASKAALKSNEEDDDDRPREDFVPQRKGSANTKGLGKDNPVLAPGKGIAPPPVAAPGKGNSGPAAPPGMGGKGIKLTQTPAEVLLGAKIQGIVGQPAPGKDVTHHGIEDAKGAGKGGKTENPGLADIEAIRNTQPMPQTAMQSMQMLGGMGGVLPFVDTSSLIPGFQAPDMGKSKGKGGKKGKKGKKGEGGDMGKGSTGAVMAGFDPVGSNPSMAEIHGQQSVKRQWDPLNAIWVEEPTQDEGDGAWQEDGGDGTWEAESEAAEQAEQQHEGSPNQEKNQANEKSEAELGEVVLGAGALHPLTADSLAKKDLMQAKNAGSGGTSVTGITMSGMSGLSGLKSLKSTTGTHVTKKTKKNKMSRIGKTLFGKSRLGGGGGGAMSRMGDLDDFKDMLDDVESVVDGPAKTSLTGISGLMSELDTDPLTGEKKPKSSIEKMLLIEKELEALQAKRKEAAEKEKLEKLQKKKQLLEERREKREEDEAERRSRSRSRKRKRAAEKEKRKKEKEERERREKEERERLERENTPVEVTHRKILSKMLTTTQEIATQIDKREDILVDADTTTILPQKRITLCKRRTLRSRGEGRASGVVSEYSQSEYDPSEFGTEVSEFEEPSYSDVPVVLREEDEYYDENNPRKELTRAKLTRKDDGPVLMRIDEEDSIDASPKDVSPNKMPPPSMGPPKKTASGTCSKAGAVSTATSGIAPREPPSMIPQGMSYTEMNRLHPNAQHIAKPTKGEKATEAAFGVAIATEANVNAILRGENPGRGTNNTPGSGGARTPGGTTRDLSAEFNEKQILESTLLFYNTPPRITQQELLDFLNGAILAVTGNPMELATAKTKPVLSVEIEKRVKIGQKRHAKVLFRSYKGTVAAMRLQGIQYRKHNLEIWRPEGFVPPEGAPEVDERQFTLNELLGLEGVKLQANKRAGLQDSLSVLLENTSTAIENGGDRLFAQFEKQCKLTVRNIDTRLNEEGLRALLIQFGSLKKLTLITTPNSTTHKGYAFVEYDWLETGISPVVLALRCLNGFVVGDKSLKVLPLLPSLENKLRELERHEQEEELLKQAHHIVRSANDEDRNAFGELKKDIASQTASSGIDAALQSLNTNDPTLLSAISRISQRKTNTQNTQAVSGVNLTQHMISTRILSNPNLAEQLRRCRSEGERPSPVVQLVNMMYDSDLHSFEHVCDYEEEVRYEAERFGKVKEITIPHRFKPPKPAKKPKVVPKAVPGKKKNEAKKETADEKKDTDGKDCKDKTDESKDGHKKDSDKKNNEKSKDGNEKEGNEDNDTVEETEEEELHHLYHPRNHIPEGYGKIFIYFHDIISARRFKQEENGRLFDERVVCAAFYPVDRYKRGKYVLGADLEDQKSIR